MLKRLLSGSVYVAIIVGFLLLRRFVDYRLFDIFVWFICAMGTFEVSRALKEKTGKIVYIANVIFGVLFVPLFYFAEYVLLLENPEYFSFILILLMVSIYAVVNAVSKNSDLIKFLWQSLGVIYPSLLLTFLLLINRFGVFTGWLLLVITFVVSPATDTFAYLVGLIYNKIRKGNVKKLCPKLSPKKTVAGAIGGLIGGMVFSLLVYIIIVPYTNSTHQIIWILSLGLITSILTQVGDLFESFIKRSVGIKDIGKIMPGHGGVMDRVDGTVFTLPIIYLFYFIM